MKEIWKPIKKYKNYSISNKGRIYNEKTKKYVRGYKIYGHLIYVRLSKKGKMGSPVGIHVLVAKHFGKMGRGDTTAIHLNYVQFDNREPNIEGATRGDAIVRTRRYNRVRKNKLLGVYKWNYVYKNKVTPKWRAMISLSDKKNGS